jgi:hypothetical protein
VLRLKVAEIGTPDTATPDRVLAEIPDTLCREVELMRARAEAYWSDVRYATLEPVTMLWGTIVNALRVAAGSDRATAVQREVFAFPAAALLEFLLATRERMDVADALHAAFKPMPAPECQALAALLNVHIDLQLDAATMCRLVRLLDHEGPMTPAELDDLAALSSPAFPSGAFRGLRASA